MQTNKPLDCAFLVAISSENDFSLTATGVVSSTDCRICLFCTGTGTVPCPAAARESEFCENAIWAGCEIAVACLAIFSEKATDSAQCTPCVASRTGPGSKREAGWVCDSFCKLWAETFQMSWPVATDAEELLEILNVTCHQIKMKI